MLQAAVGPGAAGRPPRWTVQMADKEAEAPPAQDAGCTLVIGPEHVLPTEHGALVRSQLSHLDQLGRGAPAVLTVLCQQPSSSVYLLAAFVAMLVLLGVTCCPHGVLRLTAAAAAAGGAGAAVAAAAGGAGAGGAGAAAGDLAGGQVEPAAPAGFLSAYSSALAAYPAMFLSEVNGKRVEQLQEADEQAAEAAAAAAATGTAQRQLPPAGHGAPAAVGWHVRACQQEGVRHSRGEKRLIYGCHCNDRVFVSIHWSLLSSRCSYNMAQKQTPEATWGGGEI
jgi:hypothetical protein